MQQFADHSVHEHEYKGQKKCRGFHGHAERLAVAAETGTAHRDQTAEPKRPWKKKKSAQSLERKQIS